jgi:hypothetical protein
LLFSPLQAELNGNLHEQVVLLREQTELAEAREKKSAAEAKRLAARVGGHILCTFPAYVKASVLAGRRAEVGMHCQQSCLHPLPKPWGEITVPGPAEASYSACVRRSPGAGEEAGG